MSNEQALQVLEAVAGLAQKSGALTLGDASNALAAIHTLRKAMTVQQNAAVTNELEDIED